MPDDNTLLTALALVLLFEGFMPFVAPAAWRKVLLQLLQFRDGQLRFFGLCCLLLAMGLLWMQQ
ncbi:DUF2065 domain-containing protein [Candidatus Symbiobacter mobilis]|uniref:DUF2065 domain-containing protein n=1 Tax=Candidatus Symbiobacter mobilis CR TaxID=946483 RepID=U5N9T2_9BURK|nr:DUF2065 domain-containing protein [Candidatus Symbiobacter mobilis]AGX88075.1 hypothetical protein Cenrod_2002 [Candidatus Symbiobacter mobilis CR]